MLPILAEAVDVEISKQEVEEKKLESALFVLETALFVSESSNRKILDQAESEFSHFLTSIKEKLIFPEQPPMITLRYLSILKPTCTLLLQKAPRSLIFALTLTIFFSPLALESENLSILTLYLKPFLYFLISNRT